MEKSFRTWFQEYLTPNLAQYIAVRERVFSGKTRFQEVEVLDTIDFGRCLILDGKTQSSEADEFVYHEALVHPAMVAHPNPESVFIAGGGEGATLREVLAHNSVKSAVMVDLDGEVVEICRRFLPNHHRGAFDDPRVQLHFADARQYLENTEDTYDVIIVDLPDPQEAGPASFLYTQSFYSLLRRRLNPEGVVGGAVGAVHDWQPGGVHGHIAHPWERLPAGLSISRHDPLLFPGLGVQPGLAGPQPYGTDRPVRWTAAWRKGDATPCGPTTARPTWGCSCCSRTCAQPWQRRQGSSPRTTRWLWYRQAALR